MTQVSITTIAPGDDVAATPVADNFANLRQTVNGNLDADNLTGVTRQKLGLSDASTARRGMSYVSTLETVQGTTFAALTTPDRVSGIAMPSNGLLHISVWLRIIKTVGGVAETASVGVFLNGVQIKSQFGLVSGGSLGVFGATALFDTFAASYSVALVTASGDSGFTSVGSGAADPVDDTTAGHPVGTFVPVRVAAGTYTVELRYLKTAGATVTVADRSLYVRAEGY